MGQVAVAWPSGWHGRGTQSIVEFLGIRLGCREAVICVGEFVAGNLHHLSLEWGKRACYSICQLLLGDQSRLGAITIDSPFWRPELTELQRELTSIYLSPSPGLHLLAHSGMQPRGLMEGALAKGKDMLELGDWQESW